ncbi:MULTISPECIES: hypothetical protein [Chryseobacterium]|uniref:hypothetical protein n=1 Tax=Chryseobacterium TaxID=59732 RepID=UPI001296AFF0|nr:MULTISPECIES: hypothetical protein [Chryseobacterium]MDR6923220.1 hypothetical protein [Chryseobacterium sp. 2987]
MKTKITPEGDALAAAHGTNTIASDLVQTLINNYRSNQMNLVNKGLGITDSNSIWFDLPKLKNFIAAMEDEIKSSNPDVSDEDMGIRFYYAAYPKAEEWDIMADHPVEKEYAERHTLVMIPTMKKADENGEMLDYDFNPLNEISGKSMALFSKSKGGTFPDITFAENHGTLAPPSDPKVQSF